MFIASALGVHGIGHAIAESLSVVVLLRLGSSRKASGELKIFILAIS
jgi:hypothetical protein